MQGAKIKLGSRIIEEEQGKTSISHFMDGSSVSVDYQMIVEIKEIVEMSVNNKETAPRLTKMSI